MITSLKNPLIKQIVGLKDKRDRDRLGLFTIEGEKELLHALTNGIAIETIIYCGEILSANPRLNCLSAIRQAAAASAAAITDWVEVSPPVFAKMAYRDATGGIIAIAQIPDDSLESITLSDSPLLLVIEGIEKPGNLGALLRTADAAGVDAVILCDPAIDLYNPNVVRASLGAIFTVKTVIDSCENVIYWLKRHQMQIVTATPAASTSYTHMDYTGPTAIVFGSEKAGLSPCWRQQKFTSVTIPMRGQMDSLNLSTSGAILLYEAVRQRKNT
jgi:RNA methyltransferase, TrmH family